MTIEVAPDLLAFLQQEEVRGRNESLERRAEQALKSYNGDYYGDEVDGCSKVVARDVSEVIDHMNVSVLRTFVSGDRVVEFEPDSSQMEQVADDATEVMHRDFSRKGYSLLHDWIKEGNISTLGIVKACVEKRLQRTKANVPSHLIGADNMIEGTPHKVIEADEPYLHEDGTEITPAVIHEEMPAEFYDYLVPLEEFRINPEARDPDTAIYIASATPVYISDLIEMGFDREDVETVQGDESVYSSLGAARDDGMDTIGTYRTDANRRVILHEEYILFDADRDGIAERLCVHRVGNTILRIEETDYQPFVIYCPFPMPGRIAGHSLADKVTDIQRINTALNRLALDGLYRNLAPRTYVPDECVNENTYDDLLTVIPGGLVRYKGMSKPEPELKNDVSAVAFQAIEFMIGQRESRTGITRLNQGLDADALNKTATGTALMQAQGQQMEEYLARNFAEALARLMRLKLKLRSRYGSPMTLRVDGQYRQIDPRQWPEDLETSIRVGLGSGRKDQRLQNRMTLLEIQRECMMGGLSIVGEEQIYKSIAGVVRDGNLGSPADFVIDPETLKDPQTGQMPPKPPSPEQQKMEADAQAQVAKINMQHLKDQGQLQMQAMDMNAKISLAAHDSQQQALLQQQKLILENHIAQQEMAYDAVIQHMKLDLEARKHASDAARKDEESKAKVKSFRAGGSLAK